MNQIIVFNKYLIFIKMIKGRNSQQSLELNKISSIISNSYNKTDRSSHILPSHRINRSKSITFFKIHRTYFNNSSTIPKLTDISSLIHNDQNNLLKSLIFNFLNNLYNIYKTYFKSELTYQNNNMTSLKNWTKFCKDFEIFPDYISYSSMILIYKDATKKRIFSNREILFIRDIFNKINNNEGSQDSNDNDYLKNKLFENYLFNNSTVNLQPICDKNKWGLCFTFYSFISSLISITNYIFSKTTIADKLILLFKKINLSNGYNEVVREIAYTNLNKSFKYSIKKEKTKIESSRNKNCSEKSINKNQINKSIIDIISDKYYYVYECYSGKLVNSNKMNLNQLIQFCKDFDLFPKILSKRSITSTFNEHKILSSINDPLFTYFIDRERFIYILIEFSYIYSKIKNDHYDDTSSCLKAFFDYLSFSNGLIKLSLYYNSRRNNKGEIINLSIKFI